LLLIEVFEINIVHCLGRQHGNVDGLRKAYEGVGDVSKDDDFLDATIITINAKKCMKNIKKSFNTWIT
jgi:hypothetical protein